MITDLPPPLLAAFAAATFPLIVLARRAGGTILLALLLAFTVTLIVLPGGRALIDQAGSLPDRPQRLACFAQGLLRGAPFNDSAAASAPSCSFSGRGFSSAGNADRARQLIRDAAAP